MRLSFKAKVLVPMAATLLLAMFALTYILSSRIYRRAREEFTSKAVTIARDLAAAAEVALPTHDASTLQNFIDEYRRIEGVSYVYVSDEHGKVRVHTFVPVFPDELRVEQADEAPLSSRITSAEVSLDNYRHLHVKAPILAGALGEAHVGMDLERLDAEVWRIVRWAFASALFIAFAGIGMVWIFLSVSIGRILRLSRMSAETAREASPAGPDETLAPSGDEVDHLEHAFSSMVKRLRFQHENLERLVDERTRELVQANRDLNASMTETQQTRVQLLEASRLSALGEMAGGIAHEINNPIAIIKMNAEEIQELVEEGQADPKELLELTGKINSTAMRVAKIVRGLRTFARDGSADAFAPISLTGVVEDTLALCSQRFRNSNVELTVHGLENDITIDARGVQLSQVLLNLLGNAFDAIQALPERWVRVAFSESAHEVEIRITDSGSGIPPAVAERLFQPFFTTKEIGKGTGLGLSISKGIVEKHSGRLWIDHAAPNTVFVLALPKRQAETRSRAAA